MVQFSLCSHVAFLYVWNHDNDQTPQARCCWLTLGPECEIICSEDVCRQEDVNRERYQWEIAWAYCVIVQGQVWLEPINQPDAPSYNLDGYYSTIHMIATTLTSFSTTLYVLFIGLGRSHGQNQDPFDTGAQLSTYYEAHATRHISTVAAFAVATLNYMSPRTDRCRISVVTATTSTSVVSVYVSLPYLAIMHWPKRIVCGSTRIAGVIVKRRLASTKPSWALPANVQDQDWSELTLK